MSGGSTTTDTQQQNTTQLPPWVNQAAQQNYAFAQNVAGRPLQQYHGQMLADIGPQMQQAYNTAATGGSAGQDQYNASQAGYLGVMGQQPMQVNAGQLSNTNLNPYMNPYTQNVINATLPIMQQNLGLQQNQQQNAANLDNAFGGSRMGVQQGVTQAQGAQNMAQMAQRLNQANFGQAQQAATSDINRALQAQQLNQAAQQNQGALNIQAAQGLAGLGNMAQAAQLQNFGEQFTAGAMQQQQAQNQINAEMNKFNQAWQYPTQQLGILQSALGMTPYGTSQTGTGTSTQTTSPSIADMIGGGLNMLGGLGKTFFPGGLGAGLFNTNSDRALKTDITKIGTHPTGVPLYSYRYKSDPKTYPKVVGPMAEDVQKIAPHAVSRIPGSKGRHSVNMAALNAMIPRTPGISMATPGMGAPGPLAGPGPMGAVGPLGANMGISGSKAIRPKVRLPQIRGALGG